ncbi:MAG: hypothetical protein JWP91_4206 [Fibrobacteres bacterium]|nr:hypothetical protein [Fibrobacterota bacterium]
MHPFRMKAGAFRAAVLAIPLTCAAGVVNPDISAIGQVRAGMTDDRVSPDDGEPTLSLGETELVLDAYLNPFLKGSFTLSGGEEGVGVEEAYAAWVKGLPWGLGLKAGKYRMGFGKLNPVHPHANPFIDPPRAWISLMPGGEEGFNETAVQASVLLPTPGDWASTLSADVFQGAQFHPDEARTRLGWLGRWSNSFLLGESGALETGISGATGVDNVAEDLRGYLAGADFKAKLYLEGGSQFTMQGEGMFRRSHSVDSVSGASGEDRMGFYGAADYRYHVHCNIGGMYDQFERAGEPSRTDRSVRAFTGYTMLEESTLLRLAYEYFMPDGEAGVNTFSAQLLFTMGPHKAHQF